MAEAVLEIEGMSCEHCVARVRQEMDGLSGVTELKVEIGSAYIRYEETKLSEAELEKAVERAGYRVKGEAR